MRTRPLATAALLPLLAGIPLSTGCAVKTTAGIMQAEQIVLAAEDAGAIESALYEITTARAYLRKAQEEWADSQYEDADALVTVAVEHAEKAERIARGAEVGRSVDDLVPEEVRRPLEPVAPEPSDADLEAQQILEQVIEGGDAMVRPPAGPPETVDEGAGATGPDGALPDPDDPPFPDESSFPDPTDPDQDPEQGGDADDDGGAQ